MSNKKDWLYTFTVTKEVPVQKQEEQEINGEKVTINKTVKEKKPVYFAIKRPNRRMYEAADMFYGVELSEGIRAGLLTKALLLKRYRNDGGALSEPDTKLFEELISKLALVENKYERVMANLDNKTDEERQKEIALVLGEKKELLEQLQTLETINQSLFAHTAESRATNKLNAWWVVNLAYFSEDNENFVEYFPGDKYDDKIKNWDDKAEAEDAVFGQVAARLNLIIGLWQAGARSKEEFAQGEKEYGGQQEKPVENVDA
jgi:hypothetical protein